MNFFSVVLAVSFVTYITALCSDDTDCSDGCCVSHGFFTKCHGFANEGSTCGLAELIGCGCRPGLDCQQRDGGYFRVCVDNGGSGASELAWLPWQRGNARAYC